MQINFFKSLSRRVYLNKIIKQHNLSVAKIIPVSTKYPWRSHIQCRDNYQITVHWPSVKSRTKRFTLEIIRTAEFNQPIFGHCERQHDIRDVINVYQRHYS